MKQLTIILLAIGLTTSACGQVSKKGAPKSKKGTQEITNYNQGKDYNEYEVATFAGGCFWCTEACFERIAGVIDVISGYAGGHTPHATYKQVGMGKTGHTESIQVYFDPNVVSYEILLGVFFVAHDATQVNRQGNDVGLEYRSAIFFHNETQKLAIDSAIETLEESGSLDKPIATEIAPYKEFWVAEEYHQNYYEIHPENSYVRNVSRPKVEKIKKIFANILKPKYRK